MIIQNEKAAGKFATGFKYTVLEMTQKDDTAYINYATPEYENYRPGKMNTCTMEIETGFITAGYCKHKLEPVGDVEKVLSEVNKVIGKTFALKEFLKEHGFRWDKNEAYWVKEKTGMKL